MDMDDSAAGDAAAETVECPFCAERISARAKKCRFCGETLDVALRRAEEALRATERSSSNVFMNAAAAAPVTGEPLEYRRPHKSRVAAILLALLLGGIGGHKFYLGRPGWGLVYFLFCWTFIPAVVAFIEAIIYLFASVYDFHRKYG